MNATTIRCDTRANSCDFVARNSRLVSLILDGSNVGLPGNPTGSFPDSFSHLRSSCKIEANAWILLPQGNPGARGDLFRYWK